VNRVRALGLALTILAAAAASAQTPSADLQRGRQARFAGRLAEADQLFDRVLAKEPQNYMALYNKGLIFEPRAARAATLADKRLLYRSGAQWLEKALAARPADSSDYTIYNSLGAMYLGAGDLTNADRHLSVGVRNSAQLTSASRGKLFTNVGYLFALRGNNTVALKYLDRGASLGNPVARENASRLRSSR
jgi:Flp pilus assembly protein TadD